MSVNATPHQLPLWSTLLSCLWRHSLYQRWQCQWNSSLLLLGPSTCASVGAYRTIASCGLRSSAPAVCVAPAPVLEFSLFVCAKELNHHTKTGIVDGPVVLGCPWPKWMIKVLPFWARGPPPQRPSTIKSHKKGRALGLSTLTMYQTRHSSASIDRLKKARFIAKVQRCALAVHVVGERVRSSRVASAPLRLPQNVRHEIEACRSIVEAPSFAS